MGVPSIRLDGALPALFYQGSNIDQDLAEFITRCSRLELFGVLAGRRELCCIPLRESYAPEVSAWCRNWGLNAVRSGRRFVPVFEPNKAHYSNIARYENIQASDVVFTDLLVSRTHDYCLIAARCQDDARILGTLLGYPLCCIDFFTHWYPKRARLGNDYTLPYIRTYKPFSFLNNSLLSYFDISLISHFPCSPDCAATRQISLGNLQALKTHSPDLAGELEHHLKSLVIYTEKQGIAYSNDYVVHGDTIRLNRIYAISDTLMHCLLTRHRDVTVISAKSFVIGDHRFARNSRIAMFT